MKPRGLVTTVLVGLMFIGADLIQRTVVVVIIKLRPSARERILTSWLRGLSDIAQWVFERIGGANMEILPKIPALPGTLILMNHQSLLDIPIAVRCFDGGYPKIVARDRYRTGLPLISHMIRLYGHPTVRPGEGDAEQLRSLREMASEVAQPLVIYPEGSRSRDGGIRPFRTGGLKAILGAREWSVYVVVLDGLWQSTSVGGFIRNVSSMRIRVDSVGPFAFDGADGADAFIDSMERHMRTKLEEIRQVDKTTADS
ncbi:MAG: 1-acyl-sn-glycerol-3-phosphate acyltransferase [Candidatus Latescibacterota bacterium]|nr:MAG: 1-acyl-sn-glycerol-3-phosphate acyltransferase [Candidatus Latescibacterota bacterium]